MSPRPTRYKRLLPDGRWKEIYASWFSVRDGMLICDLDGTLVDSHAAIEMAYAEAGYPHTVPFGQPWQQWTTGDVHNMKTAIYAQTYGARVFRGPAATLGDKGCYVLTTASLQAWDMARHHFFPKLRLLGWGKTLDEKVSILLKRTTQNTIYVDDDKSALLYMRSKGVKACLILCSSSRPLATASGLLVEEQNRSSHSQTAEPSSTT